MIELSQRLSERRKELNMSQADLAAQVNVHQTMISAIERGSKQPTIELLVRLQDVLGVSLLPSPLAPTRGEPLAVQP